MTTDEIMELTSDNAEMLIVSILGICMMEFEEIVERSISKDEMINLVKIIRNEVDTIAKDNADNKITYINGTIFNMTSNSIGAIADYAKGLNRNKNL